MRAILLSFLVGLMSDCLAQESDIPLGAWRLHLNYSSIKSLAVMDDHVYGAGELGVMSVDVQEQSTGSVSKLSGLSGIGVNHIANDGSQEILIIGYQDGTIDFLEDNKITNLQTLKTTTGITGSRAINHISVTGKMAYASADFGVVSLDMEKKEIRETWRDLGVAGKTIRIYQSAILKDSIFLATEKGVWCGSLTTNLLNFNNWKKFDKGEFSSGVKTITVFNSTVYTAVDGSGIFKKQNNSWVKESFLPNLNYTNLKGTDANLFVCSASTLWQVNIQNQLTEIKAPELTHPNDVLETNGSLFVGDDISGILRKGPDNSMVSFISSGPKLNSFWDVMYDRGAMQTIAGGYTESLQPLSNPGYLSSFANGWFTSSLSIKDITDVDLSDPNRSFYSSFGEGLLKVESQKEQKFDITNSPLANNAITAIERTSDGLWIANYNATNSLHLLKSDGNWESFSFPFLPSKYPTDLIQDLENNLWILLSPKDGGGIVVFNKQSNKSVYLTDQGGQGGLPSKKVRSIAIDRSGYVWVGTEQGVAYFSRPSAVFSGNVNAERPIYEGRSLLRDETILALTIDGGNRKWMGTENGAWLFDALGEKLIYNFTSDNSPLLSNRIQSIGVHPVSGEVFLGTDMGLASFRSDATVGQEYYGYVKIFPNPVTAEFNGLVAIEGLITDSTIKITDVAGKLVWQTVANGGTASWNMRDAGGKRVATGIYFVFSTTTDGSDKHVGKIAIIE